MGSDNDGPQHRGRIQAQGGGTEESEKWEEDEPPTLSAVLGKVDALEAKLQPKERRAREEGFKRLRKFLRKAAANGGIWAPYTRSDPPDSEIRVDLEVIKGRACVPDAP